MSTLFFNKYFTMMPNLEYLDNLPKIPNELVEEVYASLANPNLFDFKDYTNYTLHLCNKPVSNWVYKFFRQRDQIVVGVQQLQNDIIIHTDYNRTHAYNYIIDPGGAEVATCFYDESDNLIEKHVIEPNRWHRLRTDVRHNVIGFEPNKTRVAITVFQKPAGR